jgi:hypothetical protein
VPFLLSLSFFHSVGKAYLGDQGGVSVVCVRDPSIRIASLILIVVSTDKTSITDDYGLWKIPSERLPEIAERNYNAP